MRDNCWANIFQQVPKTQSKTQNDRPKAVLASIDQITAHSRIYPQHILVLKEIMYQLLDTHNIIPEEEK